MYEEQSDLDPCSRSRYRALNARPGGVSHFSYLLSPSISPDLAATLTSETTESFCLYFISCNGVKYMCSLVCSFLISGHMFVRFIKVVHVTVLYFSLLNSFLPSRHTLGYLCILVVNVLLRTLHVSGYSSLGRL